MWMVWFLGLFLFTVPASAEIGFDEKYERDYNIFNPINQYRHDNPLNPINWCRVLPSNNFEGLCPHLTTESSFLEGVSVAPVDPRSCLSSVDSSSRST